MSDTEEPVVAEEVVEVEEEVVEVEEEEEEEYHNDEKDVKLFGKWAFDEIEGSEISLEVRRH